MQIHNDEVVVSLTFSAVKNLTTTQTLHQLLRKLKNIFKLVINMPQVIMTLQLNKGSAE